MTPQRSANGSWPTSRASWTPRATCAPSAKCDCRRPRNECASAHEHRAAEGCGGCRLTLTGEQARTAALADKLDHKAVGFRCGLEIHQQLDTRKLFSPCPSGVVEPDQVQARTIAVIDRRLRATQSELGELDPAALAEARKGKALRYLAIDSPTSRVETDEENGRPHVRT